jgi:methyl-accepting chemotaxis protein
MEEIGGKTRSNAQNAQMASRHMEEMRHSVEEGSRSTSDTEKSMRSINESAEKVTRIVKTIEEIAFKTNLLALNAAVEAARAGEHGKGFAVVADEVRGLAQKCAQAAQSTAFLIEENARQASQGMKVSEVSGRALGEVVQRSEKAAHILSGIAEASEEQSRNIQEVSSAMGHLDAVTQTNMNNAKITEKASEELSAQSEVLNETVKRLVRVVEGEQGFTDDFARRRYRRTKKTQATMPTTTAPATSSPESAKALEKSKVEEPSLVVYRSESTAAEPAAVHQGGVGWPSTS